VLVLEGGSILRPYNPIGSELFEKEGLVPDLLRLRPAHPLSQLLRNVLEQKRDAVLTDATLTFPSGARYRVEPSQRSEKGRDRMIMLLIEPVKNHDEHLSLASLKLTAREHEVARLMLQGMSAEAMSTALEISVETLRTHVRSILAKSGTRTRLEFVARVLGDENHRP
jgi:DNA-binding CsgD family transcriptional regulator